MNIFRKIKRYISLLVDIQERLIKIQSAVGRIEARQLVESAPNKFHDYEFQVYSQWGEDGLIQYLINNIYIKRPIFIEFGVENYTESNTRFLLTNNNWAGLVIDGSLENTEFIKNDPIYWRHNLKTECAFITKDNINELLNRNGMTSDIGILSIDIDGNDYWVWKEIDSVTPAIVIVEYNARFGLDAAVTVPYDPNFIRSDAHFSHIYYGASLKAFCLLANKKGYALVGCNLAGNNAFFVRRDLMTGDLKELAPSEAFVLNKFRESRNQHGDLTYITFEEEQKVLQGLPLVDVEKDLSVVVSQ